MPATSQTRIPSTGHKLVAVYRQAWLASLGAAARTRDLVQRDARPMLRALVKEGTVVEAQAMRAVETRVESSYALARKTWRQAQRKAGTLIGDARARIPAAIATVSRDIGETVVAGGRTAARKAKRAMAATGAKPAKRAKRGTRAARGKAAKAAKPAVRRARKAAKRAR